MLGAAFLLAGMFAALATRQFFAAHLFQSGDLAGVGGAVHFAPGNAEYHELLGHLLLQTRNDVRGAAQQYHIAAALNPYDARNWLAIAVSDGLLNDIAGQHKALERAVAVDPSTPDIAWRAANFFLAQGDSDRALRQFRLVLANDPGRAYATFALCSHIADVDTLVRTLLPPQPAAYLSLVDFLVAKKDTAGATKVWGALVELRKPFESRHALAYIDYLISQHEVSRAQQAWIQTTELAGLSAHLPSHENLITNSHFESDILNSGFDWRYRRQDNVELALDSAESHGGSRSLAVTFTGGQVTEAGIAQYIPLEPGADYDFSAYYKCTNIDGAGGPRFSIEDAYTGRIYFVSDELKHAEVWRPVSGKFATTAETQLVLLKIVRVPSGSPIRGKLWVDEFRLRQE